MDPSTQGTGGIVLAKIDAALNRLDGLAPLPYNGVSGMFTIPGGSGRVDLGNLFHMLDWAIPSSGPTDFPLTLRYKSDAMLVTEFGRGWSVPFHRYAEVQTTPAGNVNVLTPVQAYDYETIPNTTNYTTLPPGTNTLVGSNTAGWTETQKNGHLFKYDATGVLQTVRNQAGVRWTLSWNADVTKVLYITGPFSRRTSFTYDGAGMIRRLQDPGGRICSFTVDASKNLVKAVTPELCVTNFRYFDRVGGNVDWRMIARIDPLGNRTSFTYSSVTVLGLFNSFRLPMGQITTFVTGTSPPRNVVIDPRVENVRAVRCYEKAGFAKVKVLMEHEMHEGAKRDSWLMEVRRADVSPGTS